MQKTVKIVWWQEDDKWLGYLQDFPDYWTQGDSLDDLRSHLRDLYDDLVSGKISGAASRRSRHLMKRVDLIKKLQEMGCVLERHGGKHDWYRNPKTGAMQPVPRHREIKDSLARRIIRLLGDS